MARILSIEEAFGTGPVAETAQPKETPTTEQPVEVEQVAEPVEKSGSRILSMEEAFGVPSVSTQAVPTDTDEEAPKNTMDDLVKNKDWLTDAEVIYQHEKGEKFKGSDAELDYWFRNRHSRLGNDLTSIGLTAADALDMSDEVKLAWANSLDTWDNTEATLGSFGNAVYQALTDPTTVGATFAGFGVGGIAKLFGQKGAALAAKFAFKDQLKKALGEKVSKEAAEEFIQTGASKAITGEALKAARKQAAKNLAINRGGTQFATGSAWGAADNLLRQSFKIDVEAATDDPRKTETDYGELAFAALGVGLGAGILGTGGMLATKLGNKKAVKKLVRQAELEDAAKPKVAEQTVPYAVVDGKNGARVIANDAQDTLEEGGTLTLDIGEKVSPKNLKDINDELAESGFSTLEEIADGKYATKKIATLREVKPAEAGKARTKIQKIVGRVKRGIYSNPVIAKSTKEFEEELVQGNKLKPDDEKLTMAEIKTEAKKLRNEAKTATDRAAIAQRRRESDRVYSERVVASSFKRLEKAIAKDLGIKNISGLSTAQSRLINSALKGNQEASAEVARIAPKVSEELGLMRGNIKQLQENLLETGAIREGSDLESKILTSMGKKGDEAELYLTTSYEKFDNPNWSKEVTTREGKGGKTILDTAKEFVVEEAGKRDTAFGAVKAKFQRGEALSADEQKIYNNFMGPDGEVNTTINRILDANEDDVIKAFSQSPILGRGPLKILDKKKDIPEQIRILMGEYQDPITNYARTVKRLNQTLAQINYEKEIVDLAEKGFLSGVRVGDSGTPGFGRVTGALPRRAGLADPLEEAGKDLNTGMDGIYAYPEIADAIINGNEVSQVNFAPFQNYLALQAHTRAAKTVYSITAIARNFTGAGWMSLGAGYMSPRNLKEIPKVMKGLYNMGDEELNEVMEKGISLGYLQSGTDLGSFRAALGDAGDDSFWNFTNKSLRDKNSLKNRAKKLNVSAVKFYQSMDDMWKQFAFVSEKGNYRQTMIDKGLDPDGTARVIRTSDGRDVNITNLDEFAANEVAKHMQNYAGVPQFVRYARMAPAADFLAFTTEIIRTQKNIIKTALKDIKEGRELMKSGKIAQEYVYDADGNITYDAAGKAVTRDKAGKELAGSAQSKVGQRRLGSLIAAQSAAPALAAGSYALTGMNEKVVDKNGKEMPYTIREGYEAFDQPWQKGSNFVYLGTPEKGRARRINISYLNPWAKTQDPIRAGIRALSSGGDIDENVDKAFAESVWRPIRETFGPSMITESIVNLAQNRNEYGKKIIGDTDTLGQKFRKGVIQAMAPFEPGIIKSARDIATGFTGPQEKTRELFGFEIDVPVGYTRSGMEKGSDEQIFALSGIKPETIDIKNTLGFKANDIKRLMGESGKTFTRSYQQRTPITTEELVEAYSDGMAKEYKYAKEMFDLISKAKSADLNNKDIILAITDGGLFKNRLDRDMLVNLVNKGKFIPAPPKFADMNKWAISTKKRTGFKPPVREAQNELMKVYRRYVGEVTGER